MKTKIKTETMKDLTKIYIDLGKCTEEQRKSIPQILVKNIQEYTPAFNANLSDSDIVHFHNTWKTWALGVVIPDGKTELTYPEFIKLFEGGDEETENFYEINFDGYVKAQFKIVGDKIEIIQAMNGYGNSIPLSEIIITNSK